MKIKEKPGVIYDYSGCLYPEGIIKSDITSVFNHSQIQNIDFEGYTDQESKDFMNKLKIKQNLKKTESNDEDDEFIDVEKL